MPTRPRRHGPGHPINCPGFLSDPRAAALTEDGEQSLLEACPNAQAQGR